MEGKLGLGGLDRDAHTTITAPRPGTTMNYLKLEERLPGFIAFKSFRTASHFAAEFESRKVLPKCCTQGFKVEQREDSDIQQFSTKSAS